MSSFQTKQKKSLNTRFPIKKKKKTLNTNEKDFFFLKKRFAYKFLKTYVWNTPKVNELC